MGWTQIKGLHFGDAIMVSHGTSDGQDGIHIAIEGVANADVFFTNEQLETLIETMRDVSKVRHIFFDGAISFTEMALCKAKTPLVGGQISIDGSGRGPVCTPCRDRLVDWVQPMSSDED